MSIRASIVMMPDDVPRPILPHYQPFLIMLQTGIKQALRWNHTASPKDLSLCLGLEQPAAGSSACVCQHNSAGQPPG